jgi:glutamine cyclotransferase
MSRLKLLGLGQVILYQPFILATTQPITLKVCILQQSHDQKEVICFTSGLEIDKHIFQKQGKQNRK